MTVHTIDCQYELKKEYAACYLIKEGNRGILIDNNTNFAIKHILNKIAVENIPLDNIDYCIITHVHLDHAGASGQLMKLLPNAKMMAHPRAARHIIDPTKLVNSASKVYGEENFKRMYGEIVPIHEGRVLIMEDNQEFLWCGHKLKFFHTRGHAKHHFCIFDEKEKSLFTGDAFGVSFPKLQTNGSFVFPSTSPTDFEPEEAIKTIDRLMEIGAQQIYPTHFGPIVDHQKASEQMKRYIQYSFDLAKKYAQSNEDDKELEKLLYENLVYFYTEEMEKIGVVMNKELKDLVHLDLKINAQGLLFFIKNTLRTYPV
jgi:glyoxylase-like metal-dependent hydrolase (beta-lactamase superfamily II)